MKKLRRALSSLGSVGSLVSLPGTSSDKSPDRFSWHPSGDSIYPKTNGLSRSVSNDRGLDEKTYISYNTDSIGSGAAVSSYSDPLKGGDPFFTKLHKYAYFGNLSKIRKLLQKFNINAEDTDRRTPLHWAAHAGHTDIISFLIKAGANPEKEDKDGRTPFLKAVQKRNIPSVQVFIRHKVNLNAKDSFENNALHIAATLCCRDLFELLLEVKIEFKVKNLRGQTPLHLATEGLDIDTVKLLLQYGANPNDADKEGVAPLMVAAKHGSRPLLQILLEFGADPYQPDCSGWNASFYAKYCNYTELANWLEEIEKKISKNLKSKRETHSMVIEIRPEKTEALDFDETRSDNVIFHERANDTPQRPSRRTNRSDSSISESAISSAKNQSPNSVSNGGRGPPKPPRTSRILDSSTDIFGDVNENLSVSNLESVQNKIEKAIVHSPKHERAQTISCSEEKNSECEFSSEMYFDYEDLNSDENVLPIDLNTHKTNLISMQSFDDLSNEFGLKSLKDQSNNIEEENQGNTDIKPKSNNRPYSCPKVMFETTSHIELQHNDLKSEDFDCNKEATLGRFDTMKNIEHMWEANASLDRKVLSSRSTTPFEIEKTQSHSNSSPDIKSLKFQEEPMSSPNKDRKEIIFSCTNKSLDKNDLNQIFDDLKFTLNSSETKRLLMYLIHKINTSTETNEDFQENHEYLMTLAKHYETEAHKLYPEDSESKKFKNEGRKMHEIRQYAKFLTENVLQKADHLIRKRQSYKKFDTDDSATELRKLSLNSPQESFDSLNLKRQFAIDEEDIIDSSAQTEIRMQMNNEAATQSCKKIRFQAKSDDKDETDHKNNSAHSEREPQSPSLKHTSYLNNDWILDTLNAKLNEISDLTHQQIFNDHSEIAKKIYSTEEKIEKLIEDLFDSKFKKIDRTLEEKLESYQLEISEKLYSLTDKCQNIEKINADLTNMNQNVEALSFSLQKLNDKFDRKEDNDQSISQQSETEHSEILSVHKKLRSTVSQLNENIQFVNHEISSILIEMKGGIDKIKSNFNLESIKTDILKTKEEILNKVQLGNRDVRETIQIILEKQLEIVRKDFDEKIMEHATTYQNLLADFQNETREISKNFENTLKKGYVKSETDINKINTNIEKIAETLVQMKDVIKSIEDKNSEIIGKRETDTKNDNVELILKFIKNFDEKLQNTFKIIEKNSISLEDLKRDLQIENPINKLNNFDVKPLKTSAEFLSESQENSLETENIYDIEHKTTDKNGNLNIRNQLNISNAQLKESNITKLDKNQIQQYLDIITELTKELDAKERKLNELTDIYKNKDEELVSSKNENAKMALEFSRKTKVINDYDEELKNLKITNCEQNFELNQKYKKVSELRDDNIDLKRELRLLKLNFEEKNSEDDYLKELEDSVSVLKADKINKNNIILNLRERLSNLAQEKNEILNDLNNKREQKILTVQNSLLKEFTNALKNEIQMIKANLNNEILNNFDLNEFYKKIENKIDLTSQNMIKNNSKNLENITALQIENKNLKDESNQLNAEVTKYKERLSLLEYQIPLAESKILMWKTKHEDLLKMQKDVASTSHNTEIAPKTNSISPKNHTSYTTEIAPKTNPTSPKNHTETKPNRPFDYSMIPQINESLKKPYKRSKFLENIYAKQPNKIIYLKQDHSITREPVKIKNESPKRIENKLIFKINDEKRNEGKEEKNLQKKLEAVILEDDIKKNKGEILERNVNVNETKAKNKLNSIESKRKFNEAPRQSKLPQLIECKATFNEAKPCITATSSKYRPELKPKPTLNAIRPKSKLNEHKEAKKTTEKGNLELIELKHLSNKNKPGIKSESKHTAKCKVEIQEPKCSFNKITQINFEADSSSKDKFDGINESTQLNLEKVNSNTSNLNLIEGNKTGDCYKLTNELKGARTLQDSFEGYINLLKKI